MTCPTDTASPAKMASTAVPKSKFRKRNRQTKTSNAAINAKTRRNEPTTPVQLQPGSSPQEEATPKQEVVEKMNIDEEPSEKIRLDALEKKTIELQGYVNQIQDAVTIGMYQLRDLKNQIAAATAALKSADKR
ncbi:hypothetical protein F4824DRAFT_513841 [Ustulina deusta]|nr:hypothetical protein F4824DRAFT_513841 [Ustulina deusta]